MQYGLKKKQKQILLAANYKTQEFKTPEQSKVPLNFSCEVCVKASQSFLINEIKDRKKLLLERAFNSTSRIVKMFISWCVHSFVRCHTQPKHLNS